MGKSGKIAIVADLAKEYNFTENDGKWLYNISITSHFI